MHVDVLHRDLLLALATKVLLLLVQLLAKLICRLRTSLSRSALVMMRRLVHSRRAIFLAAIVTISYQIKTPTCFGILGSLVSEVTPRLSHGD